MKPIKVDLGHVNLHHTSFHTAFLILQNHNTKQNPKKGESRLDGHQVGFCFLKTISAPYSKYQTHAFRIKPIPRISCCINSNLTDAQLSLDLTAEILKLKTRREQKEEAMEKSKEILFKELCEFLCSGYEDVKKRWKKMNEEEKTDLVNDFVLGWSDDFHPLSVKSVKDMVEEYLVDDIAASRKNVAASSGLLPGLKRILGL